MHAPLAWTAVGTATAVLVVAGVATTHSMGHGRFATTRCAVPALPGETVRVRLMDLAGMAGPGMMLGGGHPLRRGAMRAVVVPTAAAAGTVSLAVRNVGYRPHELVVLPLLPGTSAGTRAVVNGRVDETGRLGEASSTCAAGSGEGIAAGSAGWTTLRLAAGRYELVCNLRGHYAAGMYAELDVR